MALKVVDQRVSDQFALYLGDAVEVLPGLPDESIHYTIFSPPFASLYTYSNSARDLGNCRTYEEFFAHYTYIAKELYRLTKPGRLISYHCMNLPTSKERHGYIGIQDFRGDLVRAHQSVGFIFHSEVCIWKDPVTAMQRTKSIGLLYKQLRKDSCLSRQGIPDYLVTMRKPGENAERVTHVAPPTGATFKHARNIPANEYSVDKWQNVASPVWNEDMGERYPPPVWMDINPSDTLQRESAREQNDERHICPLQLQVIERGIELWSNPGDVILSPFAGIGSEGYVAIKQKRRFIGIELKESYFKQAAINLANAEKEGIQHTLFADQRPEEGDVPAEVLG